MSRRRTIALVCAALLIIGGTAAWINRHALILYGIATLAKEGNIAENRPVDWTQGPDEADAPADERPPNIIVILVDDLGINDISAFGGGVADGRVPTPNIDRLAREGANFTQAYAGAPICAPSRAMIMTGRYPTRTGFAYTPTPDGMGRIVSMFANSDDSPMPPVLWNEQADDDGPDYADQGLPGSEITIAETLQAAGYHTAHIGKWHLGRGEGSNPNDQGFDESLLMNSGLYLPEDDPDVVNARLDFDPIDQFLWARMEFAATFNQGERFAPGGYLTDYWTDEAINVIRANRNQPFFLYLAHWGVHTPLQATRADYEAVGDIGPHRLRVYAAMVRALDRSVGRILDELAAQGLDENTIIVFSSDNGGAGYIGLEDINAPYRGWKLTMFEGGIRVPLFLRWPAQIAAGRSIDTPVAHIDLMPTLAAAAGTQLPQGVAIDGQNLLAMLAQQNSFARPDNALFWQSAYYRAVRQGDWKLQITTRPERTWLFNLADDPTEQNDLSAQHPERVAQLRALIDAHQVNAREPLYPYTLEGPVAVDHSLATPFREGDTYVYWPN